MLHDFITEHRNDIIARCRAKIASRPAPRPTDDELEYGVPLFLAQIGDTSSKGRVLTSGNSGGARDRGVRFVAHGVVGA